MSRDPAGGSRRPAATDESGRPIVAELGRAETADEKADRVEAARRKRRSGQTALNLVIALVASLAIAAFLVLFLVTPGQDREPVDYRAIGAEATQAVDAPLAVPALGEGWSANLAELTQDAADGVTTWRIGFLTPHERGFIQLRQGIDANESWVAAQLDAARPTGEARIGGLDWRVYDRRDTPDPGNLAYALVAVTDRSTVVLSGTAIDEDFEELAEAVGEELDA